MQDKLLFAAGLVALLIGLFVGVRSDNVRKTAEENLAEVNRQVVAVEQQLKMEEGRNKAITGKLSTLEKKVRVTEDKLTIANNWYAGLQDTNKMLANDIYATRLAMVEVLADLKAEPSAAVQKSASDKLEQLVRMLDEHNASPGSSEQPASEEAAKAPPESEAAGPATGGEEESKQQTEAEKPEEAPAAEAPAPETSLPAASGQGEEAAPAEKKEKGADEAPGEVAPAEPEQKSESGSHDAKKEEGAVRL